jgi:ribosomal protein S18 acetylase RimI-like enzyme
VTPPNPSPPPAPRRATLADVPAVAELHRTRIAEGFLATLGPRLLGALYRRLVRSPGGVVVVAGPPGAVVGFVAVTTDTGAFYREFLARDGLRAGFGALGGLLRRPRAALETLRYGLRRGDRSRPRAELLAVAVAPQAAGRGVGAALVAAALAEARARGVHAVRVVTAGDNAPALALYAGAGFRPHGAVEVHRGVPQRVLVWP